MPTVFDQQFAVSGFPQLLENFGEPITYYPTGGGKRKLMAIVERNPPAIISVTGNAVMPSATIRVHNARCGIQSSTVNIGTDEIELPLEIGDTTLKRFSLMTLLSQDSGVTHLALT